MKPARTLQERIAKPDYEVLVVTGFANGAQQLARLDYRGRTLWRTRRIAERHAREFTERHGLEAYLSEC